MTHGLKKWQRVPPAFLKEHRLPFCYKWTVALRNTAKDFRQAHFRTVRTLRALQHVFNDNLNENNVQHVGIRKGMAQWQPCQARTYCNLYKDLSFNNVVKVAC